MISKECFAYIQLPNSFDTITVGKLRWQKAGANSEVGSFTYGKSYLKNSHAIALDPFSLPLEEKEFQVTTNEGVHGPIRDASPDSWGRYVIQKNTPLDQHDPMGYLLKLCCRQNWCAIFRTWKSTASSGTKFQSDN